MTAQRQGRRLLWNELLYHEQLNAVLTGVGELRKVILFAISGVWRDGQILQTDFRFRRERGIMLHEGSPDLSISSPSGPSSHGPFHLGRAAVPFHSRPAPNSPGPPLLPRTSLAEPETWALASVSPQVWSSDLFYNRRPLLPSFLGLLARALIRGHPCSWNFICKYGNLCTSPTLLISLELFIKISLAFPARHGSASGSACQRALPAR